MQKMLFTNQSSSNAPILTIGIPTFNRPAELHRTLHRLREEQIFGEYHVEILVGDNGGGGMTGSNGGPEFQTNSPNVTFRHVVHDKNIGLEGNVRFLVQSAAGKFIWLLADDDFLVPGSISGLLGQLGERDHVGLRWTLDHGNGPEPSFLKRSELTVVELLEDYWRKPIFISSIVFRVDSARAALSSLALNGEKNYTYPQTLLFFKVLEMHGSARIYEGYAVEDSRPEKNYTQLGSFRVRTEDFILLYSYLKRNFNEGTEFGSIERAVVGSSLGAALWELATFGSRAYSFKGIPSHLRLLRRKGIGLRILTTILLIAFSYVAALITPKLGLLILYLVYLVSSKIESYRSIFRSALQEKLDRDRKGSNHFDYHPT